MLVSIRNKCTSSITPDPESSPDPPKTTNRKPPIQNTFPPQPQTTHLKPQTQAPQDSTQNRSCPKHKPVKPETHSPNSQISKRRTPNPNRRGSARVGTQPPPLTPQNKIISQTPQPPSIPTSPPRLSLKPLTQPLPQDEYRGTSLIRKREVPLPRELRRPPRPHLPHPSPP